MFVKISRLCCCLLVLLSLQAIAAAGTIVTSFYPIFAITRNLTEGIDELTVHNLTEANTGCLHDYQLQTGDMRALSAADVFVINGAGMESYLSMVYEALPDMPVIDASEGIQLLVAEDMPVVMGETETEVNAHIWLDVKNAEKMAENICNGLISIFPDKEGQLNGNLAAYQQRLKLLNQELLEGLECLNGADIITFHEAFPYFARAYGLHVAAVVAREPGDAISPTQLSSMIRLVEELGTPPLFVEPQYSDIAAETIAKETGAVIWTLDPAVTGPMDEGILTAYEDALRADMQVLLEAFAGR